MKQIYFLYLILIFVQYIKSSTIQILNENKNLIEKHQTNFTENKANFYYQKNFRNAEKFFSKDINFYHLKKEFRDETDFFINKIFNTNKSTIKNEIIPKEMNYDLENIENIQNLLSNIPNGYSYLKSYTNKNIDFYKFTNEVEQKEIKRFLQINLSNNKCSQFNDCFNCTSYSDKDVDCVWSQNICMNNTRPSRIRNWWNYFDNCLADNNSLNLMNRYCGTLNFETLPLTISLNNLDGLYGAEYLFCRYRININDSSKLVSVNFIDNIFDSNSIFVLQITYMDGSIINKTLPALLEWVLQGVSSLTLYYFTRKSYSKIPFKVEINNEEGSNNNYLGLFVSLGVVVFICLICSVCFYKCTRIIIENANRRLEQRRRLNTILPINLNLMPIEEEDIRKSNQEILKKLLETDLKPMKYNEKINHFDTNCTICLEEFNTTIDVIFLFCKHIFHSPCLKDWLDKNILMPKCPNCNINILTGGVIDLNNLHQNSDNLNNENVNVNLNNNNQLINIQRQEELTNLNINENNRETNIINIIQNSNENNNIIINPNYIDNNVRNNINSNILFTDNVEVENFDKNKDSKIELIRINSNLSPEMEGINYKNNDNKNNFNNDFEGNTIHEQNINEYLTSPENIALNDVDYINAIHEDPENLTLNKRTLEIINLTPNENQNKDSNIPPPNRPFSKQKKHNNYLNEGENIDK